MFMTNFSSYAQLDHRDRRDQVTDAPVTALCASLTGSALREVGNRTAEREADCRRVRQGAEAERKRAAPDANDRHLAPLAHDRSGERHRRVNADEVEHRAYSESFGCIADRIGLALLPCIDTGPGISTPT